MSAVVVIVVVGVIDKMMCSVWRGFNLSALSEPIQNKKEDSLESVGIASHIDAPQQKLPVLSFVSVIVVSIDERINRVAPTFSSYKSPFSFSRKA